MSIIPVDPLTAYESPSELCWRLVHDGVTVITLFKGIGYTWTRNNLFCATTEKECLDEIAKKGLKYTPEKNISAQKVVA
jgi:hypothetical protein